MPKLDPAQKTRYELQALLGDQAERILESDLFEKAIDAPELNTIREWLKTKPEETQKRELLWAKCQGFAEIRDGLTRLRSKGRLASTALREDEEGQHDSSA